MENRFRRRRATTEEFPEHVVKLMQDVFEAIQERDLPITKDNIEGFAFDFGYLEYGLGGYFMLVLPFINGEEADAETWCDYFGVELEEDADETV